MATEKRLIEANQLKTDMYLIATVCNTETIFIDAIIDEIDNADDVDAVEVVHGRWFSLTDCANAGVYCSVCHKKVWKEDYAWCNRKNKLRSNYCPNCGAKMDGEQR